MIVYVVSRYYKYEGFDEPEAVFSTYDKAFEYVKKQNNLDMTRVSYDSDWISGSLRILERIMDKENEN